jgi:arylsulfatase B/arylsulfatase I/J
MGLYDNSAAAVPWLTVDSAAMTVSLNFTLLPELLATRGYVNHAVGKWHLGYTTKAYTPTHRGYSSYLGYYNAMTHDYWTHVHGVSNGCDAVVPDMSNSTGLKGPITVSKDNGTYEATLFGDRAVQIVEAHDQSVPLFLYYAFHNEHDPHQAPRSELDTFPHIRSDTYKVTAALIETMDVQVRRERLQHTLPTLSYTIHPIHTHYI